MQFLGPVTRPIIREYARQRLGKLTAVANIPPGQVGDPYDSQPNPTNWTLDVALFDQIARLNLKIGFATSGNPIQFPFSASSPTSEGAAIIVDLMGTKINSVMSAWVTDTAGTVYPLNYTSSYDLGRDQKTYPFLPPGLPRWLFIEGYRAYLWPAPDFAGFLNVRAGMGIVSPQTDQDPIQGLSDDEALGFGVIVARTIAAEEIDDQVMASRLKILEPEAQDRETIIITSVSKRNRSYVPGITVRTLRVFAGRRSR